MAEYISKKCIYDIIYKHQKGLQNMGVILTLDTIDKEVQKVPAADVQPVDRWISCKDNMPDTLESGLSIMYSDCCLVCDAFGWVGMAYYITDGQKSWWEFADAQNKNKIDWTEVTHWQPLPEPPRTVIQNEYT